MKILTNGIAVVESDSHLSKWIEEQGTLEVAKGFCELFRQWIPYGGTVVDVGACLGDHTATYSAMVGPYGLVWAFEPNIYANVCLVHNMASKSNVTTFGCGLGDCETFATANPAPNQSQNLGATQLTVGGEIPIHKLDNLSRDLKRLDFMKIDAEGWEPRIIRGGLETIARLRPAILVEINHPVLKASGFTAEDVLAPLRYLHYHIAPCEPHLTMDMDMVDVLCTPS